MLAMAFALALDAALGWPERLYRRAGHPVSWIGASIAWLDRRLNRGAPEARRRRGALTVILVVAATAGLAWAIAAVLPGGILGALLTGLLAWPLIAARSLHDHVRAVAHPLGRGDVRGARTAVSMIVGRETARLDEAGIARASIESLAENASDGVVAPLFWGALLGLPGLAAYKAINTMDSMIGHRSARYVDFGRAAARLDDAVNLLPARLTGALLCLVAPRPRRAWHIMRREAPGHRSPNAGWPEAAMAAALSCRLSGPRIYEKGIADEPWLNGEAPDPGADEIDTALALFRRAMIVAGGILLAGAMA